MIIGKLISFITRRDGSFKRRAVRRLGSPRASVFLEYAIVLPLVVLVISAMIEFAAFWDAKIMANHTAWTCARIASVEAGQRSDYVDVPDVNRLRTTGMKTATTLLMSTCAMGSMHGSSSEYTKAWFNKLIREPLNALKEALKKQLSEKLVDMLVKAIGKYIGKDVITGFVKEVVTWIAKKLFDPLIDQIVGTLDKLFDPMFQFLGGVLDGNRQLRQLAYAAGRMVEFGDIITVTELRDPPYVFAKQPSVMSIGDWRLDFPRVLDSTATMDDWFVRSDAPWPPNNQRQRMIDVSIRWPFERAWMFPVLSQAKLSAEDAKAFADVAKAHGRAMAYPQPIIRNANLKSEGAEVYDPGNTNKVPDVINRIKTKYIGFIKTAALYYHYQMTNEEIGPYDSSKDGSGTYKGIGLYGGEGRKDGEDKYWTHDGLVYWMGRGPEKPEDRSNQGVWDRTPRPADYYRCWKEVSEEGSEQCLFWNGTPFFAANRPKAAYWRLKKKNAWDEWLAGEGKGYHQKEWFFWGDGDNRHLRLKHRNPADVYKELDAGANLSRFVVPRDTTRTDAYGVGKSAFEGRVPGGERGIVTFERYQEVQKNDAGGCRLRSNMRPCVKAWCVPETSTKVVTEEPYFFDGVRYTLAGTNDAAWQLMRACSRELDAAVGGKDPGGSADPGHFMDFGMTDDEILKNPDKAAEIIEKKLNELKPKVYAAARRVDKAEQALRDIDAELPKKMEGWRRQRETDLVDFAVAVARASVAAGSTDVGKVCSALQQLRNRGDSILEVVRQMHEFYLKYELAVCEFYNAELELGKVLNCKAAKDKLPARPDPTPPCPKPPPDPDRPGPSSEESGSDEDNGGDSWSKREDGWYKDGKNPEDT